MSIYKRTRINAVLGEEFDKLLETLGVKEDFEAGKYCCNVCKDKVTADNVLLIFPLSENEVGFICNKPKCITEYKLTLES
jgi:hypothetical protein